MGFWNGLKEFGIKQVMGEEAYESRQIHLLKAESAKKMLKNGIDDTEEHRIWERRYNEELQKANQMVMDGLGRRKQQIENWIDAGKNRREELKSKHNGARSETAKVGWDKNLEEE